MHYFARQLAPFVLRVRVVGLEEDPSTAQRRLGKPPDGFSGNGNPKGPHDYQLLIIGVPKAKKAKAEEKYNRGHRIFVGLDSNGSAAKKVKILLLNSDDETNWKENDGECDPNGYNVVDYDGTDGEASFCLPDPFEGDTVNVFEEAEYAIYARALGKPGGSANMALCVEYDDVEDICDGDTCTACSSGDTLAVPTTSGKKGRKAIDVSQQLLTICADIDGDSTVDNVGLFDDIVDGADEDYWWDYDNNGLKLAQLRFYPSGTVNRRDACS